MTEPTARRVVRERIDPRLTASLFANDRSAADALLELVDNAVDARIDGQVMTLDPAMVPESERKVNELMVVSLGLTKRRRRVTRQAASRKGDRA